MRWNAKPLTCRCDARKGQRQEFEYIRHGTQSLIASLDIVTGKVVAPHIGLTRTEIDYAQHLRYSL
jgi:hypothetical protein